MNFWGRLKLAWRILRSDARTYRVKDATVIELKLDKSTHVFECGFQPDEVWTSFVISEADDG